MIKTATMEYFPAKYSAKVWLCSLLFGPIVATVAGSFMSAGKVDVGAYLFLLFPPILCIVALLSCFTWLLFWGIINIVIRTVPEPFLQKFWIMLVGAALTFGTFYLLFYGDDFLQKRDFLSLTVGYGLGIITGTWYCDLSKPIAVEESNHPKLNEDHEC